MLRCLLIGPFMLFPVSSDVGFHGEANPYHYALMPLTRLINVLIRFYHGCLPCLILNAQVLPTIACQDPELISTFSYPSSTCQKLRALDSELRAHIRGNDPEFDLSKLAFYGEATGCVQENHILDGQNAVQNARKSSLQAAWNLFRTSVENDQVVHERYISAAKTDEARARSSALTSLEVGGYVCWLFLLVLLLRDQS